jgi:hypothetical protein
MAATAVAPRHAATSTGWESLQTPLRPSVKFPTARDQRRALGGHRLPLSRPSGHPAATAALIVESPEGAVREHPRAAGDATACSCLRKHGPRRKRDRISRGTGALRRLLVLGCADRERSRRERPRVCARRPTVHLPSILPARLRRLKHRKPAPLVVPPPSNSTVPAGALRISWESLGGYWAGDVRPPAQRQIAYSRSRASVMCRCPSVS